MTKVKNAVIDDRMGRKKFEGVRVFVRDLFINGFKDRDGLNALLDNKKRAADESRQIIASILREYYKFEKVGGQRYLIAIDTREKRHNPIHNIWKTKTFSGTDIMMHFYILDYLNKCEKAGVTAFENKLFDYIVHNAAYDEDGEELIYENSFGKKMLTVDKLSESKFKEKLIEMEDLGLITSNRKNGVTSYAVTSSFTVDSNLLDFASEVMPISTIGSFLLDRQDNEDSIFAFKHNMISQVLDDGVMYLLFEAISEKREVKLETYNRRDGRYYTQTVVPLFIIRNVQTGRQYLACWNNDEKEYKPLRLDYIKIMLSTENKHQYMGEVVKDYDKIKSRCRKLYKNIWGVNLFNTDEDPKRVSFTIKVDENTEYVARRLEREKRGGTVEDLGEWKYRFSMHLYDSEEILPWIATFYGYIVDLDIQDEEVLNRLKANFEIMSANYLRSTKEMCDA